VTDSRWLDLDWCPDLPEIDNLQFLSPSDMVRGDLLVSVEGGVGIPGPFIFISLATSPHDVNFDLCRLLDPDGDLYDIPIRRVSKCAILRRSTFQAQS
jgi:hypothetical protein